MVSSVHSRKRRYGHADRGQCDVHHQMERACVQPCTGSVPQSGQESVWQLSIHRCLYQYAVETLQHFPEGGESEHGMAEQIGRLLLGGRIYRSSTGIQDWNFMAVLYSAR